MENKGIFLKKQKVFLEFFSMNANAKWWQIKRNTPKLNRDLLSNFWRLRSENHLEFSEKMYDVYGRTRFRKIFLKWYKNEFATPSQRQKDDPLSGNRMIL